MTTPTSKLRAVSAVFLGVLVLGASACTKDEDPKPADSTDDPALLAEDGTDSSVAEIDAELVTSSLISPTQSGGSLTLASTDELGADGAGTQNIGDGAKALYFPRTCVSVTADQPTRTVTYAFDSCTGPNGIFRINGTIKATYTTSPGLLVLDLVGTHLQVNRAVVDWSAHAEIKANGTEREMTWKGSLSGTTGKGKTFSRTNEKVVTWRFGERCYAVSGVSEGKVRDRYLRTEITGFRRCQGACPEAGGKITISNESKLKVEITFDGTRRATYSSPKGTTTFDLACGG